MISGKVSASLDAIAALVPLGTRSNQRVSGDDLTFLHLDQPSAGHPSQGWHYLIDYNGRFHRLPTARRKLSGKRHGHFLPKAGPDQRWWIDAAIQQIEERLRKNAKP